MQELIIPLQQNSRTPLYEQIYAFIKGEIQNGSIPVREKLPSTRALSMQLQVSRSTVDLAYEQLLSEGYIESVPYVGYFTAEVEGLYQLELEKSIRPQEEKKETVSYAVDFTPSGIDLENFPFNTWRKLSREILSSGQKELFQLGDPQGEWELRETISAYLHYARGVKAKPSQIVIGAGNDYLLMLLGLILGEGRKFAMENPGYRKAYRILQQLNYPIAAVEMDHSGIIISDLERSEADTVYVMPSHHYPTGIIMPLKRRLALLKWAAEREERYIIEDDYDSEFRYKGKPIPALQGYDREQKVIYISTFSKSIAPAIRISYMVLPEPLLAAYNEKAKHISSTVSRTDQMILDQFIRDGFYERHLNKMRAVYKGKHDQILNGLKRMEGFCNVYGEQAGVHLLVEFQNGMSEAEITAKAKDHQIRLYGLSEYYIVQPVGKRPAQIVMGYANLSEEQIRKALDVLYKILLPISSAS